MATAADWLGSPDVARLGHARPGEAADAVGGTTPALVIAPGTPQEAAAALQWAARERLPTVIRGGGTKCGWGRPPSRVDVVLATSRLNGVVAHRYGDLTATVQAGTTLTDLNRELAREGQWLPLESGFEGATIGGLIATNEAGPLRHRYGTPRDLLIGITLALTDGRLVKSGGHVVKNVAGYDLGKLVSGSYGTLAGVVDATFKLSPLLPASQTLALSYAEPGALAGDVAVVSGSQLEPLAVDLRLVVGPAGLVPLVPLVSQLLVRFATSPDATAAQASAAAALLKGKAEARTGAAESALWTEQVRRPWVGDGAVVRLSWLPASLPDVLAIVDDLQRTNGGTFELTARAVVGAGFLRIDADEPGVRASVERLRGSGVVSHVVVLRQPPGPAGGLDVWGPAGSTAPVLRALKQTFDPAGILNAGRGPI